VLFLPDNFEQEKLLYPSHVVAFGAVTGVRINYKPDFCVEYDRTGKPLASYEKAATIGRAYIETLH
jgi:hypothetical protein